MFNILLSCLLSLFCPWAYFFYFRSLLLVDRYVGNNNINNNYLVLGNQLLLYYDSTYENLFGFL